MLIRALLMKVNTKNHQMEHCPCPKYGMIYILKFTSQKKNLKNEQALKFTFPIMLLLNNHKYQQIPKILDGPK